MSLRKLKRKLFTGVLAGMVLASSAAVFASTDSYSKTYYSDQYDYWVTGYVQYTHMDGPDRGDYYLNMGGPDKDQTYITYEVYKRWGAGGKWHYKTYKTGKLGHYKGFLGFDKFEYTARGYQMFEDAESFRVRINMDHNSNKAYYIAADNLDW